MKKGIFGIIIILLSVNIAFTGCFENNNEDKNNQFSDEINEKKIFNTTNEEQAIITGEDLDIPSILNITRYEGTNTPSIKSTEYVWPNVIDIVALNFYKNKIENLSKDEISVGIYFNYIVKCETIDEIKISFSEDSHLFLINDIDYFFGRRGERDFQFGYISFDNKSELINWDKWCINDQKPDYNVSFHLNQSFLIFQDFSYSEYYGPLAGFGGSINQVIILDNEYKVRVILLDAPGGWIS